MSVTRAGRHARSDRRRPRCPGCESVGANRRHGESRDAPPPPAWDAPHLQFEVASVKANKSGPTMMMMRTLPTSFNMANLPVRMLITQAYRASGYQLATARGNRRFAED